MSLPAESGRFGRYAWNYRPEKPPSAHLDEYELRVPRGGGGRRWHRKITDTPQSVQPIQPIQAAEPGFPYQLSPNIMDGVQKEQISSQTNILDRLNEWLDPQKPIWLETFYHLLTTNQYVKIVNDIPTLEQLKQYFQRLQLGLEYVRDNYGVEALPENIKLYDGLLISGEFEEFQESDWIAYFPRIDELGVSLFHIAGQCYHYGKSYAVFSDKHLPIGMNVIAEDYTVLQAIE